MHTFLSCVPNGSKESIPMKFLSYKNPIQILGSKRPLNTNRSCTRGRWCVGVPNFTELSPRLPGCRCRLPSPPFPGTRTAAVVVAEEDETLTEERGTGAGACSVAVAGWGLRLRGSRRRWGAGAGNGPPPPWMGGNTRVCSRGRLRDFCSFFFSFRRWEFTGERSQLTSCGCSLAGTQPLSLAAWFYLTAH